MDSSGEAKGGSPVERVEGSIRARSVQVFDLLAHHSIRFVMPNLVGDRLSHFFQGEIAQSEFMIYGSTSVSRFVRVNGVVAEECAHGLPFPFSDQCLESLGIDANGGPVKERTSAVQVPIHYPVIHGG
jgi:hypothetical protein